jgi:hypothetical protein
MSSFLFKLLKFMIRFNVFIILKGDVVNDSVN